MDMKTHSMDREVVLGGYATAVISVYRMLDAGCAASVKEA
jgi:hypothetical protein